MLGVPLRETACRCYSDAPDNVWQYRYIGSIGATFALEEELFLDRGAVVGGHDGCQRQVVTAFALRQLVLCADGRAEVFWLRSAPLGRKRLYIETIGSRDITVG